MQVKSFYISDKKHQLLTVARGEGICVQKERTVK